MATTYGQIEREVHQLLANIKGGDIATVETNYAAASSNTNRNSPDFAFTPVRDAIIDAIVRIREAIADTPRYPDWILYSDFSPALGPVAPIPTSDGGSDLRIGPIGSVEDSSTNKPLILMPLDKVRDYQLYSATIYAGDDIYWYALSGKFIYHTRASARAWFNIFARETFVAGSDITLRDHHAPAVVQGAAAQMAQKEGRYSDLFTSAEKKFQAHLADIRSYSTKSGEDAPYLPISPV